MTTQATLSQLPIRLDYTAIPFTDNASRTILQAAVIDLTRGRGGSFLDPSATVSILQSLLAEAQASLYEAVADARDSGCSWNLIATRLATTVPSARHRFGPYSNWRRQHPPPS